MSWSLIVPVVQPDVRELCVRPYPGHRHGCPNHGRRATCPPRALMIGDLLDLRRPVWVIWNDFAFGAHVERMRRKHPERSERQLACCLYWQGSARKQLEAEIARFLERGSAVIVRCPEACGVNVTATMRKVGVELEWPPRKIARQVALAGGRSVSRG